ncbi:hypothetical protein [Puniceibacterium confluentis]|uniref:hypothetical protein n=1 Tax=Puniceibacterium confluentis TaxID=1958944 RepID=UPI0011B4101D|nr:hypothetical protein [Puniceibacterium confluentis]
MARKKPGAAGVEIETTTAAEIEVAPGRVRRFPAGWTGVVMPDIASALARRRALRNDGMPEAPSVLPTEEAGVAQ